MERLLRHIVLFAFKEEVGQAGRDEVRRLFTSLREKIPQICGFECGGNISPEGLAHGYEDCYLVSFRSEADRDAYLPHPAHREFSDFIGPLLKDVLVFDYWA